MGSGVYVGEPSSSSKLFEMTGGTISGNGTSEAPSNSIGAGVYVASGAKFIMNGANALISNNVTTKNGAGVYVDSVKQEDDSYLAGVFELKNGKIQGNTTTGTKTNGGGVYLAEHVDFKMTGGKIGGTGEGEKNHCVNNGGAICALGNNEITLQAGEISGNTAGGTVQGVFLNAAGATSKVTLFKDFVMGNEIRYNSLSGRTTENPALKIVGSLTSSLNLGFHKKDSVYIECDSEAVAEANKEKIVNFYPEKQPFTEVSLEGKFIKITFKNQ